MQDPVLLSLWPEGVAPTGGLGAPWRNRELWRAEVGVGEACGMGCEPRGQCLAHALEAHPRGYDSFCIFGLVLGCGPRLATLGNFNMCYVFWPF